LAKKEVLLVCEYVIASILFKPLPYPLHPLLKARTRMERELNNYNNQIKLGFNYRNLCDFARKFSEVKSNRMAYRLCDFARKFSE
jgi:hypothetical protein